MREWQDKAFQVLIVGAGPTGLMMACQMAIHHVSFCIIDKNDTPSINSGALIVQARTLEIFEQMGIACTALKEGIVANKVNMFFNGKKNISTNIKNIGGDLTQFPFLLMLEQSKTEKLLVKFIGERGHSVDRGIVFKSFIQDKEKTTSVVILPDGSEQLIKSKYIIAADGTNSAIRNFLNISFIGKTYPKPIFILDCKAKTDIYPGEICFAFSNKSVSGIFPLQDSRWRIDSTLPKEIEKLENITFDTIAKDFHLWTKMNINFQGYEWFSVSHSHQKYAALVRVRNCFLVGDAAHVNSPVGAQGMNTGLQDSFNLAWKLAFVINRKAKAELLDTYSTERLGISKGFAQYADIVFKLVTSNNAVVKFFRFYVIKILLKVLFPLMEKQRRFRQFFFTSISQIGIHYRNSSLSYVVSEGSFLSDAPRPGDRLPYAELLYKGRNTNNYEILDVGCFNLIIFSTIIPEEIKKIAEKYNLMVKLVSNLPENKKIFEKLGITKTGYYLVRPDMHIALRSAISSTYHLNKYLQTILI